MKTTKAWAALTPAGKICLETIRQSDQGVMFALNSNKSVDWSSLEAAGYTIQEVEVTLVAENKKNEG